MMASGADTTEGNADTTAGTKTSFKTQAKALFWKNLAFQARNHSANARIIITPIGFCILLLILQIVVNNALDSDSNKCGCKCLLCCDNSSGTNICKNATDSDPCVPGKYSSCNVQDKAQCGLSFSTGQQAFFCEITDPVSWPAFLQVPEEPYRALPYRPNAAMVYTGQNQTAADALASFLFQQPDLSDPSALAQAYSGLTASPNSVGQGLEIGEAFSALNLTVGTPSTPGGNLYVESAFVNATAIYNMVPNCSGDTTTAKLDSLVQADGGGSFYFDLPFNCATAQPVWQPTVNDVNSLLFCGYLNSDCSSTNGYLSIQGISQAWDFLATTPDLFSVSMWYNDSVNLQAGNAPPDYLNINKGINLATNAFLQWTLGDAYTATLNAVMEFPKPGSKLTLDFSSLLGALFFTWMAQLLLPVMLVTLVSEKEKKLRIMMKMHGLGDGAYWSIQYVWFLALYIVFAIVLIAFGSIINLKFFRLTSYAFTIVFFIVWGFCLVSFSFLCSTFFNSTKTAVVSAFLYVFATGLLGSLLFSTYMGLDEWWCNIVEIVPSFALFRGLYIMSQYSFRAAYEGGNVKGLTFAEFNEDGNGLPVVFVILIVEGFLMLPLAWYLEQVLPSGTGVRRHPLFFLRSRKPRSQASSANSSQEMVVTSLGKRLSMDDPAGSRKSLNSHLSGKDAIGIQMEADDVHEERLRVETLHDYEGQAIVIKDLCKVYPAQDGNLAKMAVRSLTLAVADGECFGLLGPNGAGKSSAINMLVGLQEPTSGHALTKGLDIRTHMEQIYPLMGVCPQHDLLWDQLTARETLLFYARLKNLRGDVLKEEVDRSLQSVNLAGSLANKRVGQFSGGMKRRLSVAIALIGNPRVIYLDEPSTGLDPSSRRNLWSVVKEAKAGRGIVLTTHSMEEAEVLCDRLGIFVDGQLVCIGNPKELTSRYGGYLVFTITTAEEDMAMAERLVADMSPNAQSTYRVGGTQKYELPMTEVSISGVFAAVEQAKSRLHILDWGVSNATLEEVFIKFARSLGVEGGA